MLLHEFMTAMMMPRHEVVRAQVYNWIKYGLVGFEIRCSVVLSPFSIEGKGRRRSYVILINGLEYAQPTFCTLKWPTCGAFQAIYSGP